MERIADSTVSAARRLPLQSTAELLVCRGSKSCLACLHAASEVAKSATVQSVRLDVHFDRAGRAVTDALAGCYPATQLGAADADLRHLDLMATHLLDPLRAGDFAEAVEVDGPAARPSNGDRQGQFANSRGTAPMGQVGQHVGPKQEKQLAARVF